MGADRVGIIPFCHTGECQQDEQGDDASNVHAPGILCIRRADSVSGFCV
jgi:hypothetical protein